MKLINKIDQICNDLGGPIGAYAPRFAIKEYDERIQNAVNDLQEIKRKLKTKYKVVLRD